MTNLLWKPLFWTNVAAFTVTGLVVAGLAFGWTNPGATPPGGGGAITVDASGNVGVGTANPFAKLHVAGNFLVGSGFGITLGGVKKLTWPGDDSNVGCGVSAGQVNCQITVQDKIYLVVGTLKFNSVTGNTYYAATDVTSVSVVGTTVSQ